MKLDLPDRLLFAALGAFVGCFLGFLCWLLYGCGFSATLHNAVLHPVLKHWLYGVGGGFAILGFVMQDKMANVLGDLISVIFHVEAQTSPIEEKVSWVFVLVFAVLIVALVWSTAPTNTPCTF